MRAGMLLVSGKNANSFDLNLRFSRAHRLRVSNNTSIDRSLRGGLKCGTRCYEQPFMTIN